jgi:YNFM family putative membrane transporter
LFIAAAMLLFLIPSITAIGFALAAVCAGCFAVHAAAVGALNRRLSSSRGRANALYVLFYYVGGGIGITLSGFACSHGGWTAVVVVCFAMLAMPIISGLAEQRYPTEAVVGN